MSREGKRCRSILKRNRCIGPASGRRLCRCRPAAHLAVRGQGDPNQPQGSYQQAVSILYAVAYTLKMSPKSGYAIAGFFDYVVPPLEGFWWQEAAKISLRDKSAFHWISVLRLPDFIRREDFEWAARTAERKKKLDCSPAEFLRVEEGMCAQILHIGSFDSEQDSIDRMSAFVSEQGYQTDLSRTRLHHEIYLSDARKVAPEKRRTIIRQPIRLSER